MASKDHDVQIVHVTPERLWGAIADAPNLFPKVAPQMVKSIEQHGGPHPGGTRTVHYGPVAAEMNGTSYVKEKLVSIDPASKTVVVELVEGGPIGKFFKSVKLTSKMLPGDKPGTTKATLDVEYDPIGDPNTELFKKAGEGMLKTLEKYLHENPEAYA